MAAALGEVIYKTEQKTAPGDVAGIQRITDKAQATVPYPLTNVGKST